MSRIPHLASLLAAVLPAVAAIAQPDGFVEETVVTGLDSPVGLAFAPNGRMFIWEKGGVVWIVEDGVRLGDPLIDLSDEVNTYWTRGMTGLALDPDYESNGYVYLAYTVDWEWHITGGDPDPKNLDTNHDTFGRVVRYTSDPDDDFRSLLLESRWEMVGDAHDNGFAVTFASHTQDSIVFAPDGTMLISAGDAASMLSVDTGGPRESCCSSNTAETDGILSPKEQVGSFRAQLVDTHSGKILRIDPATAEGVPSNPYFDPKAPSAPRSRVWSLGLRNPFAFAVRPGTGSANPGAGDPGVLMIGDVGWDRWERLCVATAPGQNFGWPTFEGLGLATGYPATNVANLDAPNPLFDGATCTQEFLFFNDLLIQETLNPPSWPNPCDAKVEIPSDLTYMHRRAAAAWRNDRVFNTPLTLIPTFTNGLATTIAITDPDSPVTGPNLKGRATVGGAFYDGDKFRATYRGSLFFGEAGSPPSQTGWINRAVFNEKHELVEIAEFRPSGSLYPTGITVDPNGYAIYYANHLFDGAGSIRRIVVDCNDNGVGDDEDIADGTSEDDNENGIPDECDRPGDVNGDGLVDFDDVLIVLGAWGPCPEPPALCPADLNNDQSVDFDDLLLILGNWD